jgi:hypothetical protein
MLYKGKRGLKEKNLSVEVKVLIRDRVTINLGSLL